MSSSRTSAAVAVVLGALALLAIPAAILASQLLQGVRLLQSVYVAVPVSCGLACLALGAARQARFRAARSVRGESGSFVRLGRLVAWAGFYIGVTGALALGVYGALRWAGTR
jgi:hypothetical protein